MSEQPRWPVNQNVLSESVSIATNARENVNLTSMSSDTSEDLSAVRAQDLRNLSESEIVSREDWGRAYTNTFRTLQLRPEMYERFYNGVLRVVRKKHITDIKRGTDFAYRTTTTALIRGFGYLIWCKDSTWLLDEHEFEQGESRIIYVKAAHNGENDSFYPIFDSLWRKMRNLMFENKPISVRRWKSIARKQDMPTVNPKLLQYESDDTCNQSEISKAARTPKARMNEQETEEGILKLISDLANLRMHSDSAIFGVLWEQHLARLEEIENADTSGGDVSIMSTTSEKHVQVRTEHEPQGHNQSNLSNTPFSEKGLQLQADAPLFVVLAPVLPANMAVYISIATSNRIALQQQKRAYTWPDAPVQVQDMSKFLQGIISRTSIKFEDVLGWVLSYGWNDICRFIFNDDLENANVHAKKGTVFEDWQYRRIGWSTFQDDLKNAALQGVRIWRMKVCVVGKK